jgi:hypothetical protein
MDHINHAKDITRTHLQQIQTMERDVTRWSTAYMDGHISIPGKGRDDVRLFMAHEDPLEKSLIQNRIDGVAPEDMILKSMDMDKMMDAIPCASPEGAARIAQWFHGRYRSPDMMAIMQQHGGPEAMALSLAPTRCSTHTISDAMAHADGDPLLAAYLAHEAEHVSPGSMKRAWMHRSAWGRLAHGMQDWMDIHVRDRSVALMLATHPDMDAQDLIARPEASTLGILRDALMACGTHKSRWALVAHGPGIPSPHSTISMQGTGMVISSTGSAIAMGTSTMPQHPDKPIPVMVRAWMPTCIPQGL